jgi:serine protease Do
MVKKDETNDTNTDQTVKSNTSADSIKTHKPMAQTRWALPIVAAIIAGFIGGYFAPNNSRANNAGTPTEIQQRVVGSESELVRDIVKNVGPTVVSINVTSQGMAQNFFGYTQSFAQEGAGTGFIIDTDGTIVTNRHVVPSGTKTVSVTLSDGTELSDVEVIGRTNDSDPLDVAFLKIKDKKGKTLTAAKIGDSSKVQVGDKVVAIGNALGQFQNTVTSGIISGYGRSIEAGDQSGASTETLQNLFQTDAAINQGNSGGPLVNLSGEVIGINTAVAGGSAQNIGFSIPVDDIKGLITSVLKNGKLQRPFLGVRYIMITDDFAYQYNLPVKRGAYIAPQTRQESIIKGSPADKAGLKEKDIITEINGVKLDEKNSIISVLGKRSVGDVAELKVLRDGKEITLKATLEAAPEQ